MVACGGMAKRPGPGEIFNRLRSNPNLFAKIIVASFFVNLLALATPIYVIQVLQRYVAYGVTSTLVTLVVGIIFVTVFEFFFRNIRHRMTRETESVNASLSDKVMKKIVSIKSSFYLLQKNFRPDIVTKNLNTVQNTFNAISCDGDTSTNDMVSIFSTGIARNSEIKNIK